MNDEWTEGEQRSHTEHIINLFLRGTIYDSMGIEVIALVMTEYGLDTTEGEARVAIENCWKLGYPKGGNPRAWGVCIEATTRASIRRRLCPICSTEVEPRRRSCQECGYGSGRSEHTHSHVVGNLEWTLS